MFNKKVLFITSNPDCSGGIASVYRSISSELNNKGVSVFYSYENKRTTINYFLKYFQFLLKIRKFDILHLNTPLSFNSFLRDIPYILISKIFKKKIIVQFHGGDENFYFQILKSKILKKIAAITYFSADKLIVLGSVFIDDYNLIHKRNRRDWIILPNPVDLIFLNQIWKNNSSFENEIHLLYLSRIDHRKGCDIAIKSFSILQRNIGIKNKLILNICGDGPLLKEMKNLVKELNLSNVNFHGYVKGNKKILQYKKNDIFLYPTYYGEGLPVSLLEAMAFGLPLVTRPVGGIPDWLTNNINGYLTDSVNPKKFADIISKMILNPINLSNISKCNVELANKSFSPKSVVDEYFKIYEQQ